MRFLALLALNLYVDIEEPQDDLWGIEDVEKRIEEKITESLEMAPGIEINNVRASSFVRRDKTDD